MEVYYDIVKLVFFIFTFVVGIYQLRIKWFLPHSVLDVIWPFVMPFYLVLVWLIIGYVIGYILVQKKWTLYEEKVYMLGFVIWWVVGLILSLLYYFVL